MNDELPEELRKILMEAMGGSPLGRDGAIAKALLLNLVATKKLTKAIKDLDTKSFRLSVILIIFTVVIAGLTLVLVYKTH